MSTIEALLREIEAFLRDSAMAETTFGRHAVNDGKFVGRLREGAGVTVATVDRVRTYIAAERNRTARAAGTASAAATVGQPADGGRAE